MTSSRAARLGGIDAPATRSEERVLGRAPGSRQGPVWARPPLCENHAGSAPPAESKQWQPSTLAERCTTRSPSRFSSALTSRDRTLQN
jgi:hypothetical protein